MSFLFLDIECLVNPENENTGLNPAYPESKVIVISYNYYNSEKAPLLSEVKKPTFLYIWDFESEKELLEDFFKFIKSIVEKDEMLKIVGFNHLAYDLPFLFSRMLKNKIASERKLFDILFNFPRHIDLSQLAMAVSNKTKKDEDFRTISQKAINHYFDILVKEANGKDVSKFYLKNRKDLVKKYVEEEFTFEQLYRSLLDYFIYVK